MPNRPTQVTEDRALQVLIGGVPEHFNLPWYQAIEQSAFDSLGFQVTFTTFAGGTGAMTRAIKNREIDLALLLTEGCLADQLNGSPLRMVKTFVQSPLIWGIHVGTSSDIQTLAQIQGRRYAISRFGSGSHLMAIVDAAERGWPVDQMKFIKVNDLIGARQSLADGTADVFFWEKYTTQPLVEQREFRRLGTRSAFWPAFLVAAHEEFLEQHGVALRKILEVINRYCAALMEDRNGVPLIAKRYGLAVNQVAEWFRQTRWSVDFEKPFGELQIAREYLERLGLVPESEITLSELWWDV